MPYQSHLEPMLAPPALQAPPTVTTDWRTGLPLLTGNLVSLRELQAWNLVLLKHRPDDRRDFFTTPDDVWHILRTLAEERKKREVDPTLSVLREILMQRPASEAERHAQERMSEMHALIEQLTHWYEDVKQLETERLATLLSLGAKVTKLLEAKDRVVSLGRGRRPNPANKS